MPDGRFGPVQVVDTACSRELLINGEYQGGAFFDPPANAVDRQLGPDEPGPVCTSSYALGWLLGGLHYQTGSAIMIGLGSGAGAVQLLHEFPGLDLTVVEIDPVVIECATAGFPLLDHYADRGRLRIVESEACAFLAESTDAWDFGCADAYTGEQALVADYLPLLADSCTHLYLNIIDCLGGRSMTSISQTLVAMDKPLAVIYKACPFDHDLPYSSRSNWIAATQSPDLYRLRDYMPFDSLNSPFLSACRRGWDALIESAQLISCP